MPDINPFSVWYGDQSLTPDAATIMSGIDLRPQSEREPPESTAPTGPWSLPQAENQFQGGGAGLSMNFPELGEMIPPNTDIASGWNPPAGWEQGQWATAGTTGHGMDFPGSYSGPAGGSTGGGGAPGGGGGGAPVGPPGAGVRAGAAPGSPFGATALQAGAGGAGGPPGPADPNAALRPGLDASRLRLEQHRMDFQGRMMDAIERLFGGLQAGDAGGPAPPTLQDPTKAFLDMNARMLKEAESRAAQEAAATGRAGSAPLAYTQAQREQRAGETAGEALAHTVGQQNAYQTQMYHNQLQAHLLRLQTQLRSIEALMRLGAPAMAGV